MAEDQPVTETNDDAQSAPAQSGNEASSASPATEVQGAPATASEATASDSQQTLSQTEVEARFSQAAQEVEAAKSSDTVPAGGPGLHRFEFRAPSFLSAAEMRQLRLRHEEFVRSLTARLSIYMRLEVGARILNLETLPYRRFLDALAQPALLALIRAESMDGMGILEIPPALGLALVDRLMGGPGNSGQVERELSEIEIEVLDLAVMLLLKEWFQEVIRLKEAQPHIAAHETNPRFIQWSDPDASMLRVSLEVKLHETTGEIRIGVPKTFLEPVLTQLQGGSVVRPASTAPDRKSKSPVQWHPRLDDVPVSLRAAWNSMEITARELASLKVGDVLQIAPQQVNQVQVCVGPVPKFFGRLGTRDEAWAIELTSVL